MTYSDQITGERIAKDVAPRSEALRVLTQPTSSFSRWHLLGNLVAGVAIGSSSSRFAGPSGPVIVGVVSGVGFFLGIAACNECLSLRRRLDAVVALLRTDAHP
jgi:hypothetical protein